MTDYPEPSVTQGATRPSQARRPSRPPAPLSPASRRGARLYSADALAVNLVGTVAVTNGGDTILYPAATVIDIPPTDGAVSVNCATEDRASVVI